MSMMTSSRIHPGVVRMMATTAVICAPLMALGLAGSALAQNSTPPATPTASTGDTTYIGAITGDDVYVRSGPSDSYYPFMKVSTGAIVQVMGEKILDEKS